MADAKKKKKRSGYSLDKGYPVPAAGAALAAPWVRPVDLGLPEMSGALPPVADTAMANAKRSGAAPSLVNQLDRRKPPGTRPAPGPRRAPQGALARILTGQGILGGDAPEMPDWAANVLEGRGVMAGPPQAPTAALPPPPAAATVTRTAARSEAPLPITTPAPTGARPFAVADTMATAGLGKPAGALPAAAVAPPTPIRNARTPASVSKGGGPAKSAGALPDQEAPQVLQDQQSGDLMSGAGALGSLAQRKKKAAADPALETSQTPTALNPDGTVKVSQGDIMGALPKGGTSVTESGRLPTFMERMGGKLGINSEAKSGAMMGEGRSFMGDLKNDPDRMALLETGLGMMAAGGKPGATFGGSLGAGALGALDSAQERERYGEGKDAESAKEARDAYEFDAKLGQDQSQFERTADLKEGQNQAENYLAAQTLKQRALEAGDMRAYHQASIANDRARTGLAYGQLDEMTKRDGIEAINKYSDNYNQQLKAAMTVNKTANPLTGMLMEDGSGQKPLSWEEAQAFAAQQVPQAPESMAWAERQLQAIDDGELKLGQQGLPKDVTAYRQKYGAVRDELIRKYFSGGK